MLAIPVLLFRIRDWVVILSNTPFQEEVLLWARWSSVKLVKAQHRCIVTNPLGDKPDVGLLVRTISHEAFTNLVAPAFTPGMPDQDWMAICKRSFHVVFLRDRAFIRPPCEDKVDVRQYGYPGGIADLLGEACKPVLGAYKRGDQPDLNKVEQNRLWSNLMVRKVFGGEKVAEFIDANEDVPMPVVEHEHADSRGSASSSGAQASTIAPRQDQQPNHVTSTSASSGSHQVPAQQAAPVEPSSKKARTGTKAWGFQFQASQRDNSQVHIDLDSADERPNPCDLDAASQPHNDEHLGLAELMDGMLDDDDSDVMIADLD